MRTLPRHICAHQGSLCVRVIRGGVTYRATISGQSAEALAQAVAQRDRFLALAAQLPPAPARAPRSNTGLAGISETVKLRPLTTAECFAVSWQTSCGHQTTRRITYGAHRPRAQALRAAIALRARMTRATTPEVHHA